jgi:hypothetical protein
MSKTRILIMLLQMYIPRNWEFSQAFSKLRNFFFLGGGGGFNPPNTPLGYASGHDRQGTQNRNYNSWTVCQFHVKVTPCQARCNTSCVVSLSVEHLSFITNSTITLPVHRLDTVSEHPTIQGESLLLFAW